MSQILVPDSGGARRDRTDDLMLAKHALSQLSYGPFCRLRASGPPILASARRRFAPSEPAVRMSQSRSLLPARSAARPTGRRA